MSHPHTKPTINLVDIRSWGYEKDHFRIKSLKNSIDYQVGNCLTTQQVQDLINIGWTVNVIEKA